jgi:hypothetical protein
MTTKKHDVGNNEALIGNSIIGENTKVTITVKTALWIIGGTIGLFISIFSWSYVSLTDQLSDMRSDTSKNYEMLDKKVESLNGDLKVVLDRTSRFQYNVSSEPAKNISLEQVQLPK